MNGEKKPVAKVKVSFGSAVVQKSEEAQKEVGQMAVKRSAVKEETEAKEQTRKVSSRKKETAAKKETAEEKKETVAAAPKTEPVPEGTNKEAEAKTTPAAKKEATPRKSAAKKSTAEKKPAAAKKSALKAEVTLQWNGQDYTTDRLIQSAKDVWQYDLGRNVEEITELQIYAKPEEGKAFAVINGTDNLSFNI